jgi:hypothetical protein
MLDHQCHLLSQSISNWQGLVQPPLIATDRAFASDLIRAHNPRLPIDYYQLVETRVLFHLKQLRSAFSSLDELRGKRILDIACGSRNYFDDATGRFEPWMPRLLHSLGAVPVGIDLAQQEREAFESYQVDLTTPDALRFLESASFDATYVCGFPTRAAVHHLLSAGNEWSTIRDSILHHLHRCLKPEGKIIKAFGPGDEEIVEGVVQLHRLAVANASRAAEKNQTPRPSTSSAALLA